MAEPAPFPWPARDAGRIQAHCRNLAESHYRRVGERLLPGFAGGDAELASALAHAPFVLVSHGVEADPVLNFGNFRALALWETDWAAFVKTPSRLTAEAPNRDERARLLQEVRERGFIRDYAGVRISSRGRRFRIRRAVVWNVADPDGRPAGQAACFADWEFLPDSEGAAS